MRLTTRLILILCLIVAGIALYWLITFPDTAGLAKANPRSTALIDQRRAEASEESRPFRPKWIWVPLGRISQHLQRAVIVAEDALFYRHHGFEWEGIKLAFRQNLDRGELHRGGSTITQQLAKNLYLSSEKSLLRKAHEALITHALERELPKKRILEIYLNIAEWGHGVFGAEAAARHHFDKSAKDLTPGEAAVLAAILPSPRRYDPLQFTPYLSKRQQQILKRMGDGEERPGLAQAD